MLLPVKMPDATSKLRAIQGLLLQELAKTKQQILHWSLDMLCKITEGFGTERTKIQQVLEEQCLFNILPFKNNLLLVTSVTGEQHQVEVRIVWGLGSFYHCLGGRSIAQQQSGSELDRGRKEGSRSQEQERLP